MKKEDNNRNIIRYPEYYDAYELWFLEDDDDY